MQAIDTILDRAVGLAGLAVFVYLAHEAVRLAQLIAGS